MRYSRPSHYDESAASVRSVHEWMQTVTVRVRIRCERSGKSHAIQEGNGRMRRESFVYDSDRILSIDEFRKSLRGAMSALGNFAAMASRVVLG